MSASGYGDTSISTPDSAIRARAVSKKSNWSGELTGTESGIINKA